MLIIHSYSNCVRLELLFSCGHPGLLLDQDQESGEEVVQARLETVSLQQCLFSLKSFHRRVLEPCAGSVHLAWDRKAGETGSGCSGCGTRARSAQRCCDNRRHEEKSRWKQKRIMASCSAS